MPALQRITAESAIGEGLRCSFCGREPADGSDLIAGPHVIICDECIATCTDMLAGEDSAGAEERSEPDRRNPTGGEPVFRPTVFRLLTEGDVARLVTMDDLLEVMRVTLSRFSSGEAVQPMRTVIPVGAENEVFAVMPAYLPRASAVLGAKLVTVFGRNPALDLPTHLATVLLFNPETGALLAVLDGRLITAVRTAAVSAISADLLARDDASLLAIIGSGVQARSHLHTLERVFELSQVRVWSPTPQHQMAFLEDMESRTHAKLVGTDSAEQAVQGADLVVLATSSSEPVVQNEWINAGAHVISVGACRPDQREMDPALVQRGRLFVDSRAAALSESGDVVLGIQEHRFTRSHIAGEIGELILGKVEGRRSPRDVTIFKSLGLAVEDVAAADLVYRRAVTQDIGQELEL
jgi:ornithine cyclodeaminase